MLLILIYSGVYAVENTIFITILAALLLYYFLANPIFFFATKNTKDFVKLYALYSLMAIFTIAIFWEARHAFHLFFTSDVMRHIEDILGLSIGCYIKCQLDKLFIFVNRSAKAVTI